MEPHRQRRRSQYRRILRHAHPHHRLAAHELAAQLAVACDEREVDLVVGQHRREYAVLCAQTISISTCG